MRATTRPSLLYARLFQTMVEFGGAIWTLLIVLAIVFAIIELIALIVGVGLTRTMTRSVAELYGATQHINRGDLKHRITVTTQDQLAALESSFNSMSESLEQLIAEQKEKQRLENELAIAQEVQSQLFPKAMSDLESLEVHGVCRPARTVSGDYYDFLPYGLDRLGIAVGDISGKGISAALLMATIHSAVRAYEIGRMPAMTAHLVAAGGEADAPTHIFEARSGSNDEFSPSPGAEPAQSPVVSQYPGGKVRHAFPGRVRRPLARAHLFQCRTSPSGHPGAGRVAAAASGHARAGDRPVR